MTRVGPTAPWVSGGIECCESGRARKSRAVAGARGASTGGASRRASGWRGWNPGGIGISGAGWGAGGTREGIGVPSRLRGCPSPARPASAAVRSEASRGAKVRRTFRKPVGPAGGSATATAHRPTANASVSPRQCGAPLIDIASPTCAAS